MKSCYKHPYVSFLSYIPRNYSVHEIHAFQIPKLRILRLRSSSSCHVLFQNCPNICLKPKFLRLLHQFFKFSAPKTRQFFAEKIQNRMRSDLRTSSNHRCASSCRALHLKMRENLSAIDFLHFYCRVCKFLASKTLQFSAQNSPTARVRRCASAKIAVGDGARLLMVMNCF